MRIHADPDPKHWLSGARSRSRLDRLHNTDPDKRCGSAGIRICTTACICNCLLVIIIIYTQVPVNKFCPAELEQSDTGRSYLTSAVFSHNGAEILGSYNDDDIFLFPTTAGSSNSGYKRYRGHRNSATVKGVNFYGPRSEYVISGSDCGNIFFWSKVGY